MPLLRAMSIRQLFSLGCVNGADTGASAAFYANSGIDYILAVVTDRNSTDRALCLAGTASDTNIILNSVCHNMLFLL